MPAGSTCLPQWGQRRDAGLLRAPTREVRRIGAAAPRVQETGLFSISDLCLLACFQAGFELRCGGW